jgi:hypothetical protein
MWVKTTVASLALVAAGFVGGCATQTGGAGGYEGSRLVTPRGSYAYCPPPCYQPQWYGPQWYGTFGELADRSFYYPATPFYYDPFDPFWSGGWMIYQRPVRPAPPNKPPPGAPPGSGPGTGPSVPPGTGPAKPPAPPAKPTPPNRKRAE